MLSHKMDISMVWAVNNDNEYNEMQNTHALHTHIVGSNLITPFVWHISVPDDVAI